MTARPLLLRAAEILDREADYIAQGCSLNGHWANDAQEFKRDHDEMRAIASELRREAGE